MAGPVVMMIWVFIGVAIFKPETFVEMLKGNRPEISEEEQALVTEATRLADVMIASLKMNPSEMERAQLIQENYWKLKGETEGEKVTD